MKPEFTPRRSKYSRQQRSISVADWFWDRIGVLAERDYNGNRSRAIEGLLLYDWLVEITKMKKGIAHRHFVTAPLVLNVGEMEPLLERLLAGDSDFVGSYLDALISEKAVEMNKPPELPGL